MTSSRDPYAPPRQLLTSETPYEEELRTLNRFQLLHLIAHEGLRPQVPPWSPPELSQLMCECWATEEGMRPSSAEAVERLREQYHCEFGYEWMLSDATAAARASGYAQQAEALEQGGGLGPPGWPPVGVEEAPARAQARALTDDPCALTTHDG